MPDEERDIEEVLDSLEEQLARRNWRVFVSERDIRFVMAALRGCLVEEEEEG